LPHCSQGCNLSLFFYLMLLYLSDCYHQIKECLSFCGIRNLDFPFWASKRCDLRQYQGSWVISRSSRTHTSFFKAQHKVVRLQPSMSVFCNGRKFWSQVASCFVYVIALFSPFLELEESLSCREGRQVVGVIDEILISTLRSTRIENLFNAQTIIGTTPFLHSVSFIWYIRHLTLRLCLPVPLHSRNFTKWMIQIPPVPLQIHASHCHCQFFVRHIHYTIIHNHNT
jgi:hypothetical protein